MAITTTINNGLNQSKGISYSAITDSSIDWTGITNNTYFYNLEDDLPYYKNGSGTVLSIFSEGGTDTNDYTTGTTLVGTTLYFDRTDSLSAYTADLSSLGGVTDGDKGDITVSSGGAAWVIDNDVVTNAKLANMTQSTIKGRAAAAGTGDPTDLTAAQVRTIINVEDGADVTDATNVDAAGAVMNSDTSTAAMSFVIDEDNMSSNSATKVPTQQSVKAYVDNKVASSVTYQGGYDASTTAPSGSATKGDMYTVTVAGNGGGYFTTALEIGDVIISEIDNPSSETDWTVVNKDLDANSLLTSLKTVDGTGSGLDADLLDGLHATNFFKTSTHVTSNLDTYYTSGIVGFHNTTTGAPYVGYGQVLCIVSNGDAHNNTNNWITQLAFGTNQTSSYFRTKVNNGTWGAWQTIWNSSNDGSGSGLDADLLDGQQGAYYLNTSTNFGGDVSGTYNNIVVENDSHTHNFNNLTNKTSGTGNYATTGNFTAGYGSGAVALTVNDGYGNANLSFNHYSGVPDVNGNSARITVNVDETSNANIKFELLSNVTSGVATSLTETLRLYETYATFNGNKIYHNGNTALSKTFTLEAPTASDDITIFRTDVAITVQEVIAVSVGTTPSTTYQLKHSTDRSAAGNNLTTSSTTTSTTTGNTATLSDATIPANSWIWFESTAASGTNVVLTIDIRYTID